MNEPKIYLNDILESIERIEGYILGLSAMNFVDNFSIQDAVMRRLEIIGEAVKRLPDEIKNKYSSIPWKNIAGLRDILIHEYAGVQLERVWLTATKDLPPLKQVILELIDQQ